MPALFDEALDHFAARIKLWAAGSKPNDARLIDSDTGAPHGPAMSSPISTTTPRVRAPVDARSLRARLP